MNAFSTSEYRALNDGLMELYSTHDLVALAKASIKLIRKFIPNDMTIYTISDRTCPESTGLYEPSEHDIPKFDSQYRAYCMQHPIMLHFYKTGTSSAIRFEDTIERNNLEMLDLYNQFFRPLRAKDLMGIRFNNGKGQELALGSARDENFTERDRLRMEYLRPHLSRAFANSQLIAEAGRRPFGPAYLMTEPKGSMLITSVKTKKPSEGVVTLTSREMEILQWISEGKTNPEIGIILDISPRTAQKHVENLFRKLNVSSRTGAAIRAIELGVASATANSSDYARLIRAREQRIKAATTPKLVS